MTPEQSRRFKEMAGWLIQHPGIEESLCAECFTAQGDEILSILRQLRAKGYYELLMLFLMRSQITIEGQRALERLCATYLMQEAERTGIDTLLNDLEALLADEIEQQKSRQTQKFAPAGANES